MERVEFEVHGEVPPRNVRRPSMWRHKTETPRVIKLRRSALKAFGNRQPLSRRIKLTVEIHIPRNHNAPGDLDNYLKGICDSLSIPKEALDDPTFSVHESFNMLENTDIYPGRFSVIENDRDIVEICARMSKESDELFYKVTIEGE
jgi:Holliday junction resolvase RusA-like endonuclease